MQGTSPQSVTLHWLCHSSQRVCERQADTLTSFDTTRALPMLHRVHQFSVTEHTVFKQHQNGNIYLHELVFEVFSICQVPPPSALVKAASIACGHSTGHSTVCAIRAVAARKTRQRLMTKAMHSCVNKAEASGRLVSTRQSQRARLGRERRQRQWVLHMHEQAQQRPVEGLCNQGSCSMQD